MRGVVARVRAFHLPPCADKQSHKIIATAACLVERKFIHGCSKVRRALKPRVSLYISAVMNARAYASCVSWKGQTRQMELHHRSDTSRTW